MSLVPQKIAALAAHDVLAKGHTYTLDGFSAEFPDWHFNVRGSNTEPMLRLNLEATTQKMMEEKARRGARVHPELSAGVRTRSGRPDCRSATTRSRGRATIGRLDRARA